MTEIVMNYIVIEKNRNDEALEDKVLSYLKRAGFEYKQGEFIVGNNKIICNIKHRKGDDRCYVELQSSMRVNQGIEILQKLDNQFYKTDCCKYAEVIRAYDGVSAILSEKLFKKYAVFERRIWE